MIARNIPSIGSMSLFQRAISPLASTSVYECHQVNHVPNAKSGTSGVGPVSVMNAWCTVCGEWGEGEGGRNDY